MFVIIRQETVNDYPAVAHLIESAFKTAPYSDYQEHLLVERLRKADVFVPELSLVAVLEETLIGYILFTPVDIVNPDACHISLALAPVCVSPGHQGMGIGGRLISFGHEVAASLEYPSVVLLGDPKYYARFGYIPASKYGIVLPFDVPKENMMARALFEGGLEGVNGKVSYPLEFFV